jgi:uncharacterized protein with FMN-binding domain
MKQKLNYFVDASILVAFLLCGLTGIAKMPELALAIDLKAYASISVIHDWSGVAAVILTALHLALHARWMSVMTKQVFAPKAMLVKANSFRVLAVLIAFLLVGGAGSEAWARGRALSSATVPQGIDYPAGSLKDGTYTGTADGYMPSLTVEVVVKGGKIASVAVVKNYETPRWFRAVVGVIPSAIVKAQGTKVDSVSGATCSSYGIMSAVEAALKGAKL